VEEEEKKLRSEKASSYLGADGAVSLLHGKRRRLLLLLAVVEEGPFSIDVVVVVVASGGVDDRGVVGVGLLRCERLVGLKMVVEGLLGAPGRLAVVVFPPALPRDDDATTTTTTTTSTGGKDEVSKGGDHTEKTSFASKKKSTTILVRGSNKLVLEEAERSLHDALCVVRSLVKKRHLVAGGGAMEIECALKLADYAKSLPGVKGFCVRAFADALEVIPYTLAENAGLNAISIVTELRKLHKNGQADAGINVKHSTISNMYDEHVLQPLLVNTSALHLATECICMILKIDDIVMTR